MPRSATGIALGLAAGLAFGAGGSFIKPVLASGWSPGAAVLARISIAAVALLVPTLVSLRFDLRPLWRSRWTVLAYAAFAVVGTQLAYYAAISRISVSLALLIEYLAPVVIVLLAWQRSRRAPRPIVLTGTAGAILGLALVIGPGMGGGLDLAGIGFALIAMLGLVVYYVLGARPDPDVPPVALAGAGFAVGAVLLAAAGGVGIVPLSARFGSVTLAHWTMPWWVPLLFVGLISCAFAYVAGIAAVQRLGSRVGSFLGLS